MVHRPFPTRTLADFDPFLLLDEMGPMDLKPGEAKGVSGSSAPRVETVTYILDKLMTPRYQEVPAAKIPAASSADGTVNCFEKRQRP